MTMDGRILCPDEHPDRYGPNSGEAFASVARALRDEVLVDPDVSTVCVMVGAPGSGKSTEASRLAQRGIVVLDACHAKAGPRSAIGHRITAAGKQAVAVWMRTPLATCLERQADRNDDRKVPVATVTSIHWAIEADPPTCYDGWSEVRRAG